MNNLTPEQLAFRAGYEQGRFDAQVETAQLSKPWVGLTDEEKLVANQMWRVMDADSFIKALEAKLKAKNSL